MCSELSLRSQEHNDNLICETHETTDMCADPGQHVPQAGQAMHSSASCAIAPCSRNGREYTEEQHACMAVISNHSRRRRQSHREAGAQTLARGGRSTKPLSRPVALPSGALANKRRKHRTPCEQQPIQAPQAPKAGKSARDHEGDHWRNGAKEPRESTEHYKHCDHRGQAFA